MLLFGFLITILSLPLQILLLSNIIREVVLLRLLYCRLGHLGLIITAAASIDSSKLHELVRLPRQLLEVRQPQHLDDLAVALAVRQLLVLGALAGHHLRQHELCVVELVLDLHREPHVLGHGLLPGREAAVRLGAEARAVLLGAGRDHGAVCAVLGHQLKTMVPPLDIAVHHTRHPVFVTDVGDHAQLAADGALARAHGRGAAVDRQAGDAHGAKAADECFGLGRGLEQADLDADADVKGRLDLGDEGFEDGNELVGGAQEGGAHAGVRAEGLGAAGVDVDSGNIGGDELGALDGSGWVGGAYLENVSAGFTDGIDAVDDGLVVQFLLDVVGRDASPFDAAGSGVDTAGGSDHGTVNSLGT